MSVIETTRPAGAAAGETGYLEGLSDHLKTTGEQGLARSVAMIAVARAGDDLVAFHNHDEAYLEGICKEFITGRWTYERWESRLETALALALHDWRKTI